MADMATDIAKGVEQVSVGKAEMVLAGRAAAEQARLYGHV